MTNVDARLECALAAASPHRADPAFVLGVMRRAEEERYRAARMAAIVRGAGVAAVASALIFPLAGWVAENADAVLSGTAAAACLLALIATSRVLRPYAVSGARL